MRATHHRVRFARRNGFLSFVARLKSAGIFHDCIVYELDMAVDMPLPLDGAVFAYAEGIGGLWGPASGVLSIRPKGRRINEALIQPVELSVHPSWMDTDAEAKPQNRRLVLAG